MPTGRDYKQIPIGRSVCRLKKVVNLYIIFSGAINDFVFFEWDFKYLLEYLFDWPWQVQ